MQLVTEITVFLENHPGTLARLTESLGEQGINIRGFTLTNALDHGSLRLVVDKPQDALHLLGEHNLLTLENEILAVSLDNESRALARVAEALADAGINIEYAYGSAEPDKSSTLFMRVSDEAAARKVLGPVEGVN